MRRQCIYMYQIHWLFEECSVSLFSLVVTFLSDGIERWCSEIKFWNAFLFPSGMSLLGIIPLSGSALLPSSRVLFTCCHQRGKVPVDDAKSTLHFWPSLSDEKHVPFRCSCFVLNRKKCGSMKFKVKCERVETCFILASSIIVYRNLVAELHRCWCGLTLLVWTKVKNYVHLGYRLFLAYVIV